MHEAHASGSAARRRLASAARVKFSPSKPFLDHRPASGPGRADKRAGITSPARRGREHHARGVRDDALFEFRLARLHRSRGYSSSVIESRRSATHGRTAQSRQRRAGSAALVDRVVDQHVGPKAPDRCQPWASMPLSAQPAVPVGSASASAIAPGDRQVKVPSAKARSTGHAGDPELLIADAGRRRADAESAPPASSHSPAGTENFACADAAAPLVMAGMKGDQQHSPPSPARRLYRSTHVQPLQRPVGHGITPRAGKV